MSSFYTLEETVRDQEDLESLCKDRPLKTEEIFKPNAFYGIDYIIKTYANLPYLKPLKAIFPHGVNLREDNYWPAEINASLPVIFYYSQHRYRGYSNKSNKVLLPSASPFIYLTDLIDHKIPQKRKGSIFFLCHSTHHITLHMNYSEICDFLKNLDEKFKPITICIYWRDYNLGRHKIFLEKGYKVVSAGHMFDPYFLFRLYHLCSIHVYAMSFVIGSHTFFSVKSGCSYVHLQKNDLLIKSEGEEFYLKENILSPSKHTQKTEFIFSINTPELNTHKIDYVDFMSGMVNKKTPRELQEELLFADKLYKYGFAKLNKRNKYYFKIPIFLLRKIIRSAKKKITDLIN